MGGQSPQCLDFPQVVYFLQTVESAFDGFDCDILSGLHTLRFENFAESAFAYLGVETVLWLAVTMHGWLYQPWLG